MADAPIRLEYVPQPKQQLLHNSTARQILYGGAAGGGKSHALRQDLIMFCLDVPGIECYLFRKTYRELADNHMRPIVREVPPELGRLTGDAFIFINGSRINFCHCGDSQAHLIYQGCEFHVLAIDEATLIPPEQLIFLRSRVRLGSFANRVPEHMREFLPRAVFTANPGGPSHSFLKKIFIDGKPSCTIFHDSGTIDPRNPLSKGWTSMFIPATMYDNKHLDDGYASVFSSMAPEQAKALRDGDWDAVAGSALFSLSRSRHMLKTFKIPIHWSRFCSIDWGTAKPFSIGWWAVAGEDTLVKNNSHLIGTDCVDVFVPAGSMVRYAEWYGCSLDQPDTGLRLDSATVGHGIVQAEKERNDPSMDYYVIDSATMAMVDGPSIAEKMARSMGEAREYNGPFIPSKKNRENNYNEILSRLAGNPNYKQDGYTEQFPTIFFMEHCTDTWRTLPALLLDPTHPERGPGGGEDHAYDDLQYAVASRPFIRTKTDYINQRATYRPRGENLDPYSG